MKIKILNIIMAVFFAGMVCVGTYALADVKKPPALGDDDQPVKYTDESGDYYWGTDGYLYPWPPPEAELDEEELDLTGVDIEEQALLIEDARLENLLEWLYNASFDAMEADDLETQEKISKEIERIMKRRAEIKNELENKKKIKAAEVKKSDDAAFRDAMDRTKSIYNIPKKKYSIIYTGTSDDRTVSSPATDKPEPQLSGETCDGN